MWERGIFGSAVPVFLPCCYEYDISGSDDYFFFIRGDDTFPFGDNEDLFDRVTVKFVPYPLAEVYLFN